MKRRKAMLLGLAFLLTVAWCWRGFYLPARIIYDTSFIHAPQAKTMAERWQAEHKGWDDLQLHGMRALRMLRRPWYDYRGSTRVYLEEHNDDRIECRFYGRDEQLKILGWEKVDGTWSLKREESLIMMY